MKGNTLMERVFLVLLTVAAGFVDAYVYMHAKAFPANMTGNTVSLAISIGKGNLAGVLTPAFSIIGFITGTAIGSLLIYRQVLAADRELLINRIFLFEVIVLSGLALLAPHGKDSALLLVSIASVAMGLQGVAMTQLKVKGVSTITVTGTLTAAVNDMIFREMAVLNHKPAVQFGFALQALIWLSYVKGAAVAAWLSLEKISFLLVIPSLFILAGMAVYRVISRPASPAV